MAARTFGAVSEIAREQIRLLALREAELRLQVWNPVPLVRVATLVVLGEIGRDTKTARVRFGDDRAGARDDDSEGEAPPKHSCWRKEEMEIHGEKL